MARKSGASSRALDIAIACLLVVIAASAASMALRIGPGPIARASRPIRVELLNGSGRPGLAGELASYLRDGGFDVLEVANADRSDYRSTIVVNRGEAWEPGRSVAEYLGVDHVIQQIGSQEMIDVTVIVGRDARRHRPAR